MLREPQVPLFDLIMCLSDAMDLVSPAVAHHHKQVAYIAFAIAAELGLPIEQQRTLVLAGAVHDIGALSVKERLDALRFDIKKPHEHAEVGYLLLKPFAPLASVATLVRFHHVPWNAGEGWEFNGQSVPITSHILHLADRVAVLINRQHDVLGQVQSICGTIQEHAGGMFVPEVVDAFISAARKEYLWLDATSPAISAVLRRQVWLETIELGLDGLLGLSNLFRRMIDFRSPFTSTHSSGVAASAEALAHVAGFSQRECKMMRVAGYLHDLGKLAVPKEILHKPAKLTADEFSIVQTHTFYTYRVLEPIPDLDVINTWASFHHERLDGTGYPFHLTGAELSLGSRIMAVADVFTALTEDRPYRRGMPDERALQVLQQMAADSALDDSIVALLRLHFEEINTQRLAAQTPEYKEYQELIQTSPPARTDRVFVSVPTK